MRSLPMRASSPCKFTSALPWRSASKTSRSPRWETEDSGPAIVQGPALGASTSSVSHAIAHRCGRAAYPHASSEKPGETHLIEIFVSPWQEQGPIVADLLENSHEPRAKSR